MSKIGWVALCIGLIGGAGIGYGLAHVGQVSEEMSVASTPTPSPSSMEDMMHDMTASLEGKTGDAFDSTFLREMIVHHEGAVDMAALALVSAQHQELKDLATAIIATQNEEITQMREWLTAWYGPDADLQHEGH
jgi:uncharacterized protein (DUF305 family)